ncbi:MAG: trypsin-like peptidase domain-containing protein [Candidatus Acidiferrales bacterium]
MDRPLKKASRFYWSRGLLVMLCILAAGSLRAQTTQQSNRQRLLEQFSESMDELTAHVSPAIVQVLVTGYGPLEDKDKSDASLIGRQHSLGSGVIVDGDGYIITNAHVVKGAQRVRVILTPATAGSSQERASTGIEENTPPIAAKIIGVAPTIDLALLKIEKKGLPTLPFADYTKLKKGQLVLAFGNPEGLENTVTMGIVSAVARQPDPSSPSVYIQTDAPINPGNSGGPLVDTQGELVGINTFILTESGGSQGLGFAIPSSVVQFVYQELRRFGHVHHSIIGVILQDITADLAAGLNLKVREGVIIADVLPDGPAEKAGMKIQDILLTLDGQRIGRVPIAEMMISSKPPGTTVKAEIIRGAEKLTLDIHVAEQKSDVDELADLANPDKSLVAKLGVFGVAIDAKLAEQLEDLRIPSGVVVAALSADLSGADTDLQPKDVIHAVNGKRIESLEGLNAALNAIPTGSSAVLQVEREGKLMYISFEMD